MTTTAGCAGSKASPVACSSTVCVLKRRREKRGDCGGKKVVVGNFMAVEGIGCDDKEKAWIGKEEDEEEDGVYELLAYEELPDYMQENEYILRYYRAEWPLKHSFLSLFRWHNETLNVWTHLIGFLIFLGLTMVHLRDVPAIADLLNNFNWSFAMTAAENISKDATDFYAVSYASSYVKLDKRTIPSSGLPASSWSSATDTPRWPMFVFLFGSMFCLLSSSTSHLLCCHSRRLNVFLWRMDYAGIAVMIIASFFPPIYYIFQCEPHWQLLYLGTITAMGAVTVFNLLSPHLSKGSFRAFRAALFLAMGFSGVVPAVHATVVNWHEPQRPVTLAYESAMAALYVTGTMFYVSRIPERWRPGAFDLTGHSHQIFHAFVVAGALAHYAAALIFLEWRDKTGCPNAAV